MDWQTIGTIAGITFGVIGAGCGITGITLNWLTRRDLKASTQPLVSVEIAPHAPNWWEVQLTVQNRSAVQWQATEARLTKPRNAKLAGMKRAENSTSPWEPGEVVIPNPKDIGRTVPLSIIVRPTAGRGDGYGAGLIMGASDTHSGALLLFVPGRGGRPITISITVSLESDDAIRRRIRIPSIREITPITHDTKLRPMA